MNQRIKAIVLSLDRHRVMTQHMIAQYARLWPDHPFIFRIPFQTLPGVDSAREEYRQTPPDIPGTILQLITDLDDDKWIYWCADDKYPIALRTEKFTSLLSYIRVQNYIDGLLCCRCRITLDRPEVSLIANSDRSTPHGEVLLERSQWYQIWLHQFLRVKVLRYFFSAMPKDIPNAKVMDELKNDILKPEDIRLFVTEKNYAIFGESTQRGVITENCYRSVKANGLDLPKWFRHSKGNEVTMGELPASEATNKNKFTRLFSRKP